MAKLHEEVVVIKVSTLLKDDVTAPPVLLTGDTVASLEAVVAELVGGSVLVEVQVA